MRIYDFYPVIKEEAEMSDVVTAHGLITKALFDSSARQAYFDYMAYLRDKHGKEYSTRVHQKAADLVKPVTEAVGNYEELTDRRRNNQDPFVVYDHTMRAVILTSPSIDEATKEAVEWAEYDDITVSVIEKATKRKVLTIDGYAGAMDYYDEYGYPDEVNEDAWHGENPAWHNGNDQWHDGTDQWHSPDKDSTAGGAMGGGGAVGATGGVNGTVDLDVDVDSNKQATDVEVVDTNIQQTSNTKETD